MHTPPPHTRTRTHTGPGRICRVDTRQSGEPTSVFVAFLGLHRSLLLLMTRRSRSVHAQPRFANSKCQISSKQTRAHLSSLSSNHGLRENISATALLCGPRLVPLPAPSGGNQSVTSLLLRGWNCLWSDVLEYFSRKVTLYRVISQHIQE